MRALYVDFNDPKGDGRYAALIPAGVSVAIGDEVYASDNGGTACRAHVEELPGGRIALVRPAEGTWDRNSTIRVPV